MTEDTDWDEVLKYRYSSSEPPDWWANKHLRPISLNGLMLLAIDPRDNSIHWNGHRLQTVNRLDTPERIMAGIVAGSTLSVALLEIYRFIFACG